MSASAHGLTGLSHRNESPSALHPNKVAKTWCLVTADSTTNGSTTPAFGSHPEGILIFAPTLYFSKRISIDLADVLRFSSDSNRASGTCEQNAAVVAVTLCQIGVYAVDDQ